jgi:hypothetical protein
MNLGKITLITPPDKIFNMNLAYLLVKPSNLVKEQFQVILSQSIDDLNIFIYDQNDSDVEWLLSIAEMADCVIVDVDHCDEITSKFIAFMLAKPNVYYITNNETVPYNLISKNRIYDLNQIVEQITEEENGDDDASEE